jgi:hypothetical protein
MSPSPAQSRPQLSSISEDIIKIIFTQEEKDVIKTVFGEAEYNLSSSPIIDYIEANSVNRNIFQIEVELKEHFKGSSQLVLIIDKNLVLIKKLLLRRQIQAQ